MPHFAKPFYRRARGHWAVQIDGKQINLGRDQEQAFEQYHKIMANSGKLPPAPPTDDPTVCEILDRFTEWSKREQPESTASWYGHYCQSFLDHVGGSLTLSGLRPFHVDQWMDKHPDWSSSTRYGAISAVKRAFRWAKRRGYISVNPIAEVEKPEPGHRETILSVEQVAAVLVDVDPEFRLFLFALAEQGCRPDEVRRVEVRHVDLAAGVWKFPKEESKGKRRSRVIYLTPKMLQITRALLEVNQEGPLFRNTEGEPWTKSAIHSRVYRLQQKGVIPKGAVAYTLRHTFATEALAKGIDSVVLMGLLGHSSTRMIEKVYGHLDQKVDAMREAARRAAG